MKKQILFSLIFLLLVACSGDEVVEKTAVSSTTPPTATKTTAIPTPTIAPTNTPTPIAAISLSPQTVGNDGVLIVDEVVALEDGWLAIYAERNGQMGELLAYTAVSEGSNRDITVAIPPMLATEELIAMLYAGGDDVADFDVETAVFTHPFAVTLDVPVPIIVISNQTITEDGLLEFDNIFTAAAGWVVVYNDEGGDIGRPLAHQYVEAGENEAVTIPIPLNEATPRLHAALFVDDGEARHYEDDSIDTPVLVSGQPVVASFQATLPPSILVYDQPILNKTIVIDRAVSDGGGWVVAYDDPGTTSAGIIVGFAPLDDGLNEAVTMTLSSSTIETVYLLLHNDDEDIGEFDVPGDMPLLMEDGRLPPPAAVRTNKNSYLITRDQSIAQNGDGATVTVPLVAATRPVWLAIHSAGDGELAEEIIGFTFIPAGLNREIIVPIDLDGVTQTLYAVLHRDDGELGEFEYPDADAPLQRNFALIHSHFVVE